MGQTRYQKDIETRYSTVDEYLQELELEGYEYKVHTGDFEPLIEDVDSANDKPHALDYWSGYYSNRPTFKTDIRNLLQQIKIQSKMITFLAIQRLHMYSSQELADLYATEQLEERFFEVVNGFADLKKDALLVLHHDAVTGTCSDEAFQDYKNRMAVAFDQLQ